MEDSNLIQDYLSYLMLEKKLSDNTLINYKYDFEHYQDYLNNNKLNIKNVKEKNIVNYLTYLKNDLNLNERNI